MSSFYNDKGEFVAIVGTTIDNAIVDAIEIARESGRSFSFDFNSVTVTVEADSSPALILRDFKRVMNGYIRNVDPQPKPELSAEELESDARIEADNQARRDTETTRHQAEAKARYDRVTKRMANAPEMEFSNKEGWLAAKAANESEPYGAGILSYAERWARMMQLEISEGKTLEEVWSDTSFEADLEGMSGLSQSIATSLLTQTWVHGLELRRLHNAYWGVASTEGTVNPAINQVSNGK